MSIKVEQGHRWFRPMEISLKLVIEKIDQANELELMLKRLGFEDEAKQLHIAIQEESNNTTSNPSHGHIYDPDRHYQEQRT